MSAPCNAVIACSFTDTLPESSVTTEESAFTLILPSNSDFKLYNKLCGMSGKFKQLFGKSGGTTSVQSQVNNVSNADGNGAKFCPECGMTLDSGTKFCGGCGSKLEVNV